ncbi:MAG: hypothetical protein ABR616_09895, partial [Dermatophilaceae bacterium]
DDRAAAWITNYEAKFPSVFEVYYSAWGSPAKRGDAASQAPGLIDQIRAAEGRARHVVAQAENDLREAGLLQDELSVVLFVGARTSNGWVAEHKGQRSLFLALEYLGAAPYDDLLVVHELGRVVQAQLSPATAARTYAASLAVMVEGAATATSRELRPGHTDSAYLWMDDDHQEWLNDCHSCAAAIGSLLLRHADTPDDDEAVAPLFRNRPGHGIPARAGYWAGERIARAMLQNGTDLRELLSIEPLEARARVVEWATATHS